MRENVEFFADAMEKKLQTKDEEHGKTGWLDPDCGIKTLFFRLKEEVEEAEEAFEDCNSKLLAEECVDIANFAMMIFDRVNSRG